MGQTLSEPVTEKESAHCQNDDLAVSNEFTKKKKPKNEQQEPMFSL